MKIAIFHNYLDNIGGAEIVGLTLARELEAPIYTTNIDREKIDKMGFSDVDVRSIGRVPTNAPFRQQFASIRFRLFRPKEKYDCYIIDGDWAVSGAVKNKPNIWYVHSPVREIWDLHKWVRKNMVSWYKRPVFDVWVVFNRFLNRRYANKVDFFVCNSNNTKKRLKKYLNKDARVIHPPTNTSLYTHKQHKEYWLSVNRLLGHKRVDIQMNAFSKLPNEKLVIVGSYEKSQHFLDYVDYLESIRPENVKILKWVSSEKLRELYSECKGFITTAYNEDFGMTPVEAMASGKLVIAVSEGGYKETVQDGVTGKLIDNIDENSLATLVEQTSKELEKNPEKYKDACINRASEFDTKIFIKKIRHEIKNCVSL